MKLALKVNIFGFFCEPATFLCIQMKIVLKKELKEIFGFFKNLSLFYVILCALSLNKKVDSLVGKVKLVESPNGL